MPQPASTLSSAIRIRPRFSAGGPAWPRRPARWQLRRRLRGAARGRQRHAELAALARPGRRSLDPAAVQLHDALDQRQADAQAAWLRSATGSAWVNISNMRSICAGSMPMPLSDTLITAVVPSRRAFSTMRAAAGRVLDGVGQQVRQHLPQPQRIGVEFDP